MLSTKSLEPLHLDFLVLLHYNQWSRMLRMTITNYRCVRIESQCILHNQSYRSSVDVLYWNSQGYLKNCFTLHIILGRFKARIAAPCLTVLLLQYSDVKESAATKSNVSKKWLKYKCFFWRNCVTIFHKKHSWVVDYGG